MEQALNKRFVSIALKKKEVEELIDKLQREKQDITKRLENAIISKKTLEHDERRVLLKIQDLHSNSAKKPPLVSPSQATTPSSTLTPPKTPLASNMNVSGNPIKRSLDTAFESTKKLKDDDNPTNDLDEDIPDDDLVSITESLLGTPNSADEQKPMEPNETNIDNPTETDQPTQY